MINILTLKVGDKYSSQYVNNLFFSMKRNSTVDFNFYCYTEDSSGLVSDIKTVDIKDPNEFKLQWHKLIFHKNGFADIKEGSTCIILDIDWIIINNLDDILNYNLPENTFGCFERWWSNLRHFCKLNGGFQMYRMGETNYLWKKFIEDPEHWQQYYIETGQCEGPVNGEQNFIDNHVNNKHWLPMEWFAKYHDIDYLKIQKNWNEFVNSEEPFMMGGDFCDTIKMVHFSNADNLIHNSDDNWVFDYWYSDYELDDNFIYE